MVKKVVLIVLLGAINTLFSLDQKLLEQWEKTIKYGISTQRIAVIKAIEDNKTTEAYHLVQEAMANDPNADVRSAAVYSLINLKVNQESVWTTALSKETNSEVLRKMVFGVSELQIKSAGPRLVELLTN